MNAKTKMILVGIDDTDIKDSRGTNQLARAIVKSLEPDWLCHRIIRHQLLDDPRVPYTSKNGSASIWLERQHNDRAENFQTDSDTKPAAVELRLLIDRFRQEMLSDFIDGSDPGLCVIPSDDVPNNVVEFAHRCQTDFVRQEEARELAASCGIHLEGLGGTNDGIIGALAAVGLAKAENDGRIIHMQGWSEDFGGVQTVGDILQRNVTVRELKTASPVTTGLIDVGKKLRPNLRAGAAVLFVERHDKNSCDSDFAAVKIP